MTAMRRPITRLSIMVLTASTAVAVAGLIAHAATGNGFVPGVTAPF
jgi:hypothetical protein